jgi:hypothetical protein
MLGKVSFSLAALYLTVAALSVLTENGMDACCVAAPIPCVRLAEQKTGQGQEWSEEADEMIACVVERVARKEAELRVLNVQPKAYVWRKDMTKAELGYLKGLLEGQQGRLKDGK